MQEDEWSMVRDSGASIAHCPTSNTLLGSGVMNLDEVIARGIDYAICTDVGASPTTSILAEMALYLKIHHNRSKRATPSEALYRSTLAPARMLGRNDLGTFEVGMPLSYVEVVCRKNSSNFGFSRRSSFARGLLENRTTSIIPFANPAHYVRAVNELAANGLDLRPGSETAV